MPLVLNRRRLLAGAAALPLVGLWAPASGQSEIPDTRAGRQLAWTIEQLNNGGAGLSRSDVESRFTDEYIEALPAQRLIETFATMSTSLKPVTLARLEGGATDQHASALLATKSGYWRINLALEFEEPYRIDDYWFETVPIPQPPERPRTWSGIVSRMSRISPSSYLFAGEIIDGVPHEIAGYRVDDLSPIASTFKLYVLATLGQQVEAGLHSWSDPVEIRDELRSLPSGKLHYEPAGSRFPLEYVAERMTAESDNTATDHCMSVAGREAIERSLVSFGHTRPLATMPMLFTREWFAIRMRFSKAQIDDYLGASIAERRSILVDKVGPIADTLAEWEPWPGPADSDRIEWFASPGDLARLVGHLQQFALRPAAAPVGNAFSYNPGIVFDPTAWSYVGFKEGYETGLKAMTWLLQRRDGRWFTLIGIVHDLEEEIDGAALREMMVASAALLATHQ